MTFYKAAVTNIQKSLLAQNPCVCVTTALIAGIIAFRYFPNELEETTLVALLGLSTLLCILLAKTVKSAHICVLLLGFVVAGYINSSLHESHHCERPTQIWIEGKIISSPEEKPKTYKITVLSTEGRKECKSILYIKKDSLSKKLKYGDVILFKNNLKTIENQENSAFDYKSFLKNQNIYSQGYVSTNQWKFIGHENDVFSLCMSLRSKALDKLLLLGLNEKNHQLIAALAFGDKSLLDEETKGNFQTAGAMHILAVSGLHVGIINGILFFLFGFIRKQELAWLKILCCIGGIWMYACLTGLSPSVQRASIMCSLISISLLLKRKSSTYNSLATAAFISLLFSPNDLFSVSFQLSYGAVFSIVYFGKHIQNIFKPETIIGEYIWGIIAVSISVQIGTTPLTLYYFNTIPTYSLLTNIIVIPLSFIILICTIISLATCWIPNVSFFITKVLNFVTDYLQDAIADINTFPHPKIDFPLSLTQSLISYVVLLCLVITFEFYKQRQMKKELISL